MAASMWIAGAAENYVKGLQENDLPTIVKAIHTNEIKILDLVEKLGPYLTSVDTNTRCRGTRLLSEVLNRLPTDFLITDEVKVLVSFYCDRLKDHYTVTPHALLGLVALSTYSNFPIGSEGEILKAIFKEVDVRSMIQVDRRSVFTIVANFLETRLQELKKFGQDFVFGYIQLIAGEVDPRNLMIIFHCIPTIVYNLPIDLFVEDLYEVMSSYFPIDFTPPPNDPYGITREELVLALRKCLASSPKFAKLCLPLIMEKLSSDVRSAKVDCFQTLAACSEIYGVEELAAFLPALWTSIRLETFQAIDEETEKAPLSCLHAIIKTLSNGVIDATKSTANLDEYLGTILNDCNRHLCEPQLKLMWPTARILLSAASASYPACYKVLSTILPLMLEQFHKHTQNNVRVTILNITLEFIKVCRDCTFTEDTPSPVLPYKDSLVVLLLSLLSEKDMQLKCIAISGMVGMMSLKGMIGSKEQDITAQHLTNIILQDSVARVRSEAVAALVFMASEFPTLIKDKVFPVLLNELKSEMDTTVGQRSHQATAESLLSSLASLAVHPDIVMATIPAMIDYLLKLNEANTESGCDKAVSCLHCINCIVSANLENDQCLQFFHLTLMPQLLHIAVDHSIKDSKNCILQEERSVNSIACICRNITHILDDRLASEWIGKTMSLFLDGDLTSVDLMNVNIPFRPLEVKSPWQQTQLVSLMMSIICSVQCSINITKVISLLDRLLSLSLYCDHQLTYVSSAKCYAGLVNKITQGDELNELLDKSIQSSWKLLQDEISDQNSEARLRALTFWLWLTKSLVLRAHPKSNDMTTKLVEMFEDSELGQVSADGFYIILDDSTDVLNKDMHADIKMMYRQRFFMITLPKVVQGYEKTSADKKPHYLSALSHLLHFIPKQVLLSELPPLIPMLVQSLYCQQASLTLSTMNTLYSLVHNAPAIIAQEMDSLLPQLLKLSSYQPSMKVRIAALKCVGVLTTLPHHTVYPHQKNVLRQLGPILDDRKRFVRREAVTARNEWFMLGSGNTEN
ncbi:MMS19 nucleotide excision repair protein homolog [Glandiceps talaboti]